MSTTRFVLAAGRVAALLVVAIAATSLVTGAETYAAPREPGRVALGSVKPKPLLPDMIALKATGLYIQNDQGTRRLRFEASLGNIGKGPMEIRPDNAKPCHGGDRHVSQMVYRDDDGSGVFNRHVDTTRTRRSAGCMEFDAYHNHWHFESAARYTLFRPGHEANILIRAHKTSFCLRDSERVPEPYGTFNRSRFYDVCGANDSQGISIGWADVYQSFLTGQALKLPRRLPNGVYCLGIRVDPQNNLWETDESDNTSVRGFHLRGNSVTLTDYRAC